MARECKIVCRNRYCSYIPFLVTYSTFDVYPETGLCGIPSDLPVLIIGAEAGRRFTMLSCGMSTAELSVKHWAPSCSRRPVTNV